MADRLERNPEHRRQRSESFRSEPDQHGMEDRRTRKIYTAVDFGKEAIHSVSSKEVTEPPITEDTASATAFRI